VKIFADWSIRYKVLALLLLLGIMTFAATATIAYLKNFRAVKQNVANQLTGVYATQKRLRSNPIIAPSTTTL
jgi:hypothetical protein